MEEKESKSRQGRAIAWRPQEVDEGRAGARPTNSGVRRSQEVDEERLTAAAQIYLSVWSMGVSPEGKRLTVVAAARLAGVSVSAVKRWRERVPGFRAAEREARASSSAYAQRLARRIVEGLVAPAGRVLAESLEAKDASVAWQIIRAAGGIAAVVDLAGTEALISTMRDLREVEDVGDDHEDLDDLDGLEELEG